MCRSRRSPRWRACIATPSASILTPVACRTVARHGKGDRCRGCSDQGPRKAIYWFRNEPIADYRHKTAAELVAEGRLDAVMAYLEELRNGARG